MRLIINITQCNESAESGNDRRVIEGGMSVTRCDVVAEISVDSVVPFDNKISLDFLRRP